MKHLTIKQCVGVTARAFGIHPSRITIKNKRIKVVRPRDQAFLLARESGHSLHEIGDFFDMDPGSVLQGSRRAKALRDKARGWSNG